MSSIKKALKTVLNAVSQTSLASILQRSRRFTWNESAHVEITLSAKEVWEIQDALRDYQELRK